MWYLYLRVCLFRLLLIGLLYVGCFCLLGVCVGEFVLFCYLIIDLCFIVSLDCLVGLVCVDCLFAYT